MCADTCYSSRKHPPRPPPPLLEVAIAQLRKRGTEDLKLSPLNAERRDRVQGGGSWPSSGNAAPVLVTLALQRSQVLENSLPCTSPVRSQNEFFALWQTLLDHRRSTAATGLAVARSKRATCLATFPNHLMKTAETRDRAGDLQIFSLTLSQLSYMGVHSAIYQEISVKLSLQLKKQSSR